MLRQEALNSIGKIVQAFTEANGNYIGKLINVHSGACNVAVVRIISCIRYPKQRTLMYIFNNYERWPFTYESEKTFCVDCLEPYYGETLPEYYELMPRVLEETFLIETEADREIYERHKEYWNKMRGGISATGQI